jgi:hypothetical protein
LQLRPQLDEALDRKLDEKRLMIWKVTVRRGVTDASTSRDGSQAQLRKRLFLKNPTGRIQ